MRLGLAEPECRMTDAERFGTEKSKVTSGARDRQLASGE
jgi:hypothetical protein